MIPTRVVCVDGRVIEMSHVDIVYQDGRDTVRLSYVDGGWVGSVSWRGDVSLFSQDGVEVEVL